MEHILKGLNSNQLKAVKHNTGPLLVVAGAGTGKTTVITKRIAHLIINKKIDPSAILALTFTDKAAGEMEARVDKLVPYGFVDTWISTFHAFGDRILRENALDVGLSPNFHVLSQAEQAIFLRERIFSIDLDLMRPLGDPTKYISAVIDHISHLKDEMISPKKYLATVKSLLSQAKQDDEKLTAARYLELAKICFNYQQWLLESNLIDYGDQINLIINLFNNRKDILNKYQKQFKFILVDEFQDTNKAQNELLLLLAGPKASHQNITAVGDDDQSIYQFRGAALQNILDFQKHWPKSRIVVLNQNYRSYQTILNCAYNLIQQNNPARLEVQTKINKKLSGKSGGQYPEFNIYADDYTEAQNIIEQINHIKKSGYKYQDIAILTRANNHADHIIFALRSAGIPFIAPGATGLYDDPAVRLIISFIKSLTDFEDPLSLYYLATSDIYGIDQTVMTNINSYIVYGNLHYRQILAGIDNEKEIIKRVGIYKEQLQKLYNDIEYYIAFARDHNAGEVIYKWLDNTKFLKRLIAKDNKGDILARISLENIAAFYEKIKIFVAASEDKSIRNFSNNLRLLLEAGENPSIGIDEPDINALTVLTVHSAKGLEWPIVFLPSLSADRFPSRNRGEILPLPEKIKEYSNEKEFQVQEERRLFYVALTRAKEKLILSLAQKYSNNIRDKKTSPFVYEALGNTKQFSQVVKLDKIKKLSLFDAKPTPVRPPRKFIKDNQLVINPHQIDDYLSCPKKFEYIHILKVPIVQSWQVNYGNAIHRALGFYFMSVLAGKKPTLDKVLKTYQQEWKNTGYISYEHEQQKRIKGEEALRNFINNEQKLNRKIISVEEPFEFELEEIKIKGRFDTVFQDSGHTLILDFKSTDINDEKRGIERIKKSRQMQIYALAYENISGKRPNTALHFVESSMTSAHIFTDKQLNKTKEDIKKVAQGLKKEDYKATPEFNQCHWCAYKSICPYKTKNA